MQDLGKANSVAQKHKCTFLSSKMLSYQSTALVSDTLRSTLLGAELFT